MNYTNKKAYDFDIISYFDANGLVWEIVEDQLVDIVDLLVEDTLQCIRKQASNRIIVETVKGEIVVALFIIFEYQIRNNISRLQRKFLKVSNKFFFFFFCRVPNETLQIYMLQLEKEC